MPLAGDLGADAIDVHAKAHEVLGFWFDLLMPDGQKRRVTPDSDPDLFAATIGGIGLTGSILSMQMRLMRVPSNAMALRELRVRDLDALMDLLRSSEAAEVQPVLDRLRHEQRVIVSVRPVRETLEDLFMRAVTDPTTGKALPPGAAREPMAAPPPKAPPAQAPLSQAPPAQSGGGRA